MPAKNQELDARNGSVLTGIRVLDFTSMIAGPYCTRLLADLGAEVIKCEPPGGEFVRVTPPRRGGRSSYYGHLNCGKRSLCIDLKNTAARDVILDLASISDIVVENFRPGVMTRLGLDYAAMRSARSDIIYCAISGYGQSGPESDRPAYAPIIHAASGYDHANMQHQRQSDTPQRTGLFVADYLGGMAALSAIQSALFYRERHGTGQMIDVALLDSMLNMMAFEVQQAQFPVNEPTMLYSPSRAADGHVIIMPITQANFEALAKATGHPEWTADPRFATFIARKNNWDALMELVGRWTRQRSSLDCEQIIRQAGCPCSRYRSVAEAINAEQSEHRRLMFGVDDGSGRFLVPRLPWQMSGATADPQPRVDDLGAENDQILRGLLGYSTAKIEELANVGVLCQS